MSERARFLLATLCGLLLAVGVHIVIVLGVPSQSRQDAFNMLLNRTASEGEPAPADIRSWLPKPDPAVSIAACAFDLGEGPLRVSTKTNALFQSLSFHARGGNVFFAVTDRAAVRGELELVVMTRRQLDEALAAEDEEAPSRDVRVVAPFPSFRQKAEEIAKAVECTIDTPGEG